MMFYRMKAALADKENFDEIKETVNYQRISDRIFERSDGNVYVTAYRATKKDIFLTAMVKDRLTLGKYADEYLDELNIEPNYAFGYEEITSTEFMDNIETSVLQDFLNSIPSFKRKTEVFRFLGRLNFTDKFVSEIESKNSAMNAAKKLHGVKYLLPEIKRIFKKPSHKGEFYGHPVHYIIETDSVPLMKEYTDLLMSCLYKNKRIISRRYSILELKKDYSEDYSDKILRDYFEINKGGTIVYNFLNYSARHNGIIDNASENIIELCRNIRENYHSILNIICVPRNFSGIKALVADSLSEIPFVTVAEDTLTSAAALKYLDKRAAADELSPDDKLHKKCTDSKKDFPYSDLDIIYERWRSEKYVNMAYPQYNDLARRNIEYKADSQRSGSDAYEQLNSLIGLGEVKAIVKQITDYYRILNLLKTRHIKREKASMHMVFTGSPGTAKTTVARIFAQIMKERGILSSGRFCEVGRADLVGKYVGWTAQIVRDKFDEASGGVLFIDEAYSLVDDKRGLYGDEAINTIVQEMENRRNDIIVIFAGYQERMEDFLDSNPGLRSRIAFHVPFADYTPDELYQILEYNAEKEKIMLAEGVKSKAIDIFQSAVDEKDFGNGRFVRNMLEKAKMRQAARLFDSENRNFDDEELLTLIAEDFEYISSANNRKGRIGF